jgi:Baseplate J-like protein
MATLNLSGVVPDPDGIKAQLEAYLAGTDAWRGRYSGQTGQTLIEMIAAIGALDQAKIRRARQDSIPDTAISDRAIYALAAFQGVRLSRRLPSQGTVTLLSTASITIPAFTQFESAGVEFFNRSAIILTAAVPASTTLYQGNVVRKVTTGIGEDYSMFFSSEQGFSVSDVDVQVVINSTVITRVTDGLWKLKFTSGYVDRTMPDGRLVVQFGNTYYGAKPATTDTLSMTYVTTEGESGNSYNVLGKAVTSSSQPTLTGSFTTNLSGGADQRSAVSYKNIGAPTFGTFGSAVTGPQYQNSAREYPGVVDAVVFSQREVNPTAVTWMNLMKVVLLTSSTWTAAQKTAYLDDLQNKTMYSGRFFIENPTAVPVSVSVTIYCYPWANASQVQLNVSTAITNLFQIRKGSLGYDFYISDLTDTIHSADNGVEYFDLTTPTADVIVSARPVDAPSSAVSAGIGLIAAGTYYYAVAVTTAAGVVTTRNWTQVDTVAANSTVTLSWPAVPDAISYQVYGRTSGTPGLLSTQATLSYVDNGSTSPGTAPPAQNSVPVRYATLASLSVSAQYSTRQART